MHDALYHHDASMQLWRLSPWLQESFMPTALVWYASEGSAWCKKAAVASTLTILGGLSCIMHGDQGHSRLKHYAGLKGLTTWAAPAQAGARKARAYPLSCSHWRPQQSTLSCQQCFVPAESAVTLGRFYYGIYSAITDITVPLEHVHFVRPVKRG